LHRGIGKRLWKKKIQMCGKSQTLAFGGRKKVNIFIPGETAEKGVSAGVL